jgi:hypothetical protein
MLQVSEDEHTIALTFGKSGSHRFRFRSQRWKVVRHATMRLYCILRLLQLRRRRFEQSCPPIQALKTLCPGHEQPYLANDAGG